MYVLVIEDVNSWKRKTLSEVLKIAGTIKGLKLERINIGLASKRDAYEHDGVMGISAHTDRLKLPSLLVLVFEKEDGSIKHGRVMWRNQTPAELRKVLRDRD